MFMAKQKCQGINHMLVGIPLREDTGHSLENRYIYTKDKNYEDR